MIDIMRADSPSFPEASGEKVLKAVRRSRRTVKVHVLFLALFLVVGIASLPSDARKEHPGKGSLVAAMVSSGEAGAVRTDVKRLDRLVKMSARYKEMKKYCD